MTTESEEKGTTEKNVFSILLVFQADVIFCPTRAQLKKSCCLFKFGDSPQYGLVLCKIFAQIRILEVNYNNWFQLFLYCLSLQINRNFFS